MNAPVSRLAAAYAATTLAQGLPTEASRADLAVLATEFDRHLTGTGVYFDRCTDTVAITAPGTFSQRHQPAQVARGHSIPAIARATGRHPRTVHRDSALARQYQSDGRVRLVWGTGNHGDMSDDE